MSWILNLLIPGTGLIIRRREGLGVCLALVFGIGGNLALAGFLIAPEAIPKWLSWFGFGLAAFAWLAAQPLLWRQGRELARRERGLAAILGEARSALDMGDLASARTSIETGVAIDEENVELTVLWARLCVIEGDRQAAQMAWQRVLRLDMERRYSADAKAELERMKR